MALDIKTVVIINLIVNIINLATMLIIWRQYRKRFSGISYWLADMVCQAGGIGLILLRGVIPDFISIVLSNTIIVSGSVLILIGLESFLSKKGPRMHNYILLVLFAFLMAYFGIIDPDITMREIITSMMIVIFTSQTAFLMLFRVPAGLRPLTRFTGIVMTGYALASIARILLLADFPLRAEDFFRSGLVSSTTMAVYTSLHILLIIALILMVTKRLLDEVRIQEEKFTKAFHSSPYAVLLTSHSDGKIFEVNNVFLKITGYQYSEVIGKTTIDLHLWNDESDRASILAGLDEKNKIEEYEIRIRKKTGEMLIGLLYADIIIINNEKCILSSISDITERKQAEIKILKLLDEKELILKEVHHRIKNNMNTVNALLYLQSEEQNNALCREILNDARGRVQSMMTLYDKLYQSDNHSELSLKKFLTSLAEDITGLFKTAVPVTTQIDIEDFILDADILSAIGIIINELITNSMKHAFREIDSGVITITAAKDDGIVTLTYSDNGIGLPDSVNLAKSSGFGMQLISMLSGQINGSVRIVRGQGTKYIFVFKT